MRITVRRFFPARNPSSHPPATRRGRACGRARRMDSGISVNPHSKHIGIKPRSVFHLIRLAQSLDSGEMDGLSPTGHTGVPPTATRWVALQGGRSSAGRTASGPLRGGRLHRRGRAGRSHASHQRCSEVIVATRSSKSCYRRIHLATLPEVRETDVPAGPGRWILYFTTVEPSISS